MSTESKNTTRVLLVGQKPKTVDFTNPDLPYGFTVETIYESLKVSLEGIAKRGWFGERLVVLPDESAFEDTKNWLQNHEPYDCIVIGAGVRIPAFNLEFFESVINAIHKYAPDTMIGFNTRPEETADVAERCISRYEL